MVALGRRLQASPLADPARVREAGPVPLARRRGERRARRTGEPGELCRSSASRPPTRVRNPLGPRTVLALAVRELSNPSPQLTSLRRLWGGGRKLDGLERAFLTLDGPSRRRRRCQGGRCRAAVGA